MHRTFPRPRTTVESTYIIAPLSVPHSLLHLPKRSSRTELIQTSFCTDSCALKVNVQSDADISQIYVSVSPVEESVFKCLLIPGPKLFQTNYRSTNSPLVDDEV